MANVGDRVLARWPQEVQWWYPGVICVEIGDGYEVQFDDGDRATLTAVQVRPLAVNSGNRVHCRWKGGNIYFPGAVVRSEGAAIHVDYDDGDKEITSISMIRVNQADL